MVIPNSIKGHYPFASNYLTLQDNTNMHYIDEGKGDPVLMLHGNPTWSFFYRNLIKEMRKQNRVIAPDHIGCGLSEKPQNYDYTLKSHISNLTKLIDHLKLSKITLIVHDWGGAIGFGYATQFPSNIKRIVILNTAAFTSSQIPFRINIFKTPLLGEFAIRSLNAFAMPATFMATTKKLPNNIKRGFLLPYSNFKNRIATSRFVQDIPLTPNHQSFPLLKKIEKNLTSLKCPKLIHWGEKDFCFNMDFFKRWQKIYPHATTHVMKETGHYLLEDNFSEANEYIQTFMNQ